MPAPQHNEDVNLQRLNTEIASLKNNFPYEAEIIFELIKKRLERAKPIITPRKPSMPISQEELFSILDKLHQIAQLPSTQLDTDTTLYLEQQLADVLGFEITSTLEQHQLPFNKVTLKPLPHLQFSPSAVEESLDVVPEAGVSKHRSFFGWESNYSQTDDTSLEEEYFWLSFPLHELVGQDQSDISWWRNKKFTLINPHEGIAIVAKLKDTFLDTSVKYKVGASPAVTREGLFWSPKNLGTSLVFFTSDPDESIRCGSYFLY